MSTPSPIQPWVALIGAIVGFLLGEGSRLVRHYWQIHRNKQLVKAALKAILAQLPDKKDILNKAIISMRGGRLLPMVSVRVLAIGYQSVLEELYPHLSDLQQHCLHVIYERLRVADQFMDSFEDNFTKAIREKTFPDPFAVYIGKTEEMLESYKVVEDLAQSYLSCKPIDVFGIKQEGS
jgi:xanthosine utilization system XapX-like protein